MRYEDLGNDAERALWRGFGEGRPVDLGDGDPGGGSFDPDGWGDDRTVRASVLRALLLGAADAERGVVPRIVLSGARITGPLDIECADHAVDLVLQRCWLDERPILDSARMRGLAFYRCRLPGLSGVGVRVDGDLSIQRCRVPGQIRLPAASVAGALHLTGSVIRNPGEPALTAMLLTTGQGAFLDEVAVFGRIVFNGARIGGSFSVANAILTGARRQALTANNMTVADNFFAEKVKVCGEVRLHGVRVAGRLLLDGARLHNRGGRSLTAEGLVVARDLFCRNGFTALGEVRLQGARIAGTLEIGGTLSNPDAVALNGERLQASDVLVPQPLSAQGVVSLCGSQVSGAVALRNLDVESLDLSRLTTGTLRLDGIVRKTVDLTGSALGVFEMRLDPVPPTRLRGLVYTDLILPDTRVGSLLAWLRRDPQGFDPQPYEQLARRMHSLGHDRDARIVLLHKRRAARALNSAWWSRLPGRLFDALAGYGYLPGRALGWLVLAWLVGFFVFRPEGISVPTASADVNAALYSLDVIVPTSPFGLEAQVAPHGPALAVAIALTIVGYALSAAVIPAVARALNRSDTTSR